jgi:hypothetical protein
MDGIPITSDFMIGNDVLYIIRVDMDPYCYMTRLEDAKDTMSFLALEIAKDESDLIKGVQVLREDIPEKNTIILRKRQVGYVYNTMGKTHILDIYTVPIAIKTKYKSPPVPPPLPQFNKPLPPLPTVSYCYTA